MHRLLRGQAPAEPLPASGARLVATRPEPRPPVLLDALMVPVARRRPKPIGSRDGLVVVGGAVGFGLGLVAVGYVGRKHEGDWTPYVAKWKKQRIKLQRVYDKKSRVIFKKQDAI